MRPLAARPAYKISVTFVKLGKFRSLQSISCRKEMKLAEQPGPSLPQEERDIARERKRFADLVPNGTDRAETHGEDRA
jgi:hypothetical protein